MLLTLHSQPPSQHVVSYWCHESSTRLFVTRRWLPTSLHSPNDIHRGRGAPRNDPKEWMAYSILNEKEDLRRNQYGDRSGGDYLLATLNKHDAVQATKLRDLSQAYITISNPSLTASSRPPNSGSQSSMNGPSGPAPDHTQWPTETESKAKVTG